MEIHLAKGVSRTVFPLGAFRNQQKGTASIGAVPFCWLIVPVSCLVIEPP
jgi:hypothetical protein